MNDVAAENPFFVGFLLNQMGGILYGILSHHMVF